MEIPNIKTLHFARSPFQIVLFALAMVLLINGLATGYLLWQQRLGLTLSAQDDRVIIQGVQRDDLSVDLVGRQLLGITTPEQSMTLEVDDLLPEPDVVAAYAAYNRFFARQSALDLMLQGSEVVLQVKDLDAVRLVPMQTDVADLPVMYWVQIIVASVCFLAGLAVWSFRQRDVAAIYYALSGVCLALTVWPAAVYSSRELALDGELFRTLSALNHLGAYTSVAVVGGLFWNFPTRLGRFPLDRVMMWAMPINWLLEMLQWYPDLDYSVRLVPLSGIFLCFGLMAVHWRRSRGDIIYRQSVKWVLLTIVAGCGLPAATGMLAPLLGQPDLVSQSGGFVAFLLVYLGLAIGVTRYRLFDLDRWWFEVWVWIIVGLFVVGLDLTFITLLHLSAVQSLWLTLTLTGWLYFPLRQRVISRLLSMHRETLEPHLPLVVRTIAQAQDSRDLVRGCANCLTEIYAPLTHRIVPLEVPGEGESIATIAEDGLCMRVHLVRSGQVLELHYADQGKRLFRRQDVITARALVGLFVHALQAREAREAAVVRERERIKEDIHDTLGGRILSIMKNATEPLAAAVANSAWSELRDLLTALDGGRAPLAHAIEQWRRDAQQMVRGVEGTLEWQVSSSVRDQDWSLSGAQRIDLGQLLRELMTNALRHGSDGYLGVSFNSDQNLLQLEVTNRLAQPAPPPWVAGRGLHHVSKRAKRLGASVNWKFDGEGTATCVLSVDLSVAQVEEVAGARG